MLLQCIQHFPFVRICGVHLTSPNCAIARNANTLAQTGRTFFVSLFMALAIKQRLAGTNKNRRASEKGIMPHDFIDASWESWLCARGANPKRKQQAKRPHVICKSSNRTQAILMSNCALEEGCKAQHVVHVPGSKINLESPDDRCSLVRFGGMASHRRRHVAAAVNILNRYPTKCWMTLPSGSHW